MTWALVAVCFEICCRGHSLVMLVVAMLVLKCKTLLLLFAHSALSLLYKLSVCRCSLIHLLWQVSEHLFVFIYLLKCWSIIPPAFSPIKSFLLFLFSSMQTMWLKSELTANLISDLSWKNKNLTLILLWLFIVILSGAIWYNMSHSHNVHMILKHCIQSVSGLYPGGICLHLVVLHDCNT